MFDQDAHIAHKVLWINITSRNKNALNPQPLAWIPYHAKDKYLPQLVNAGYKVAIAEQVSDPKAKWIVKREIIRVITPGTLNLEWENYIHWISLLDPSSWEWKTWEVDIFEKLINILYKVWVSEVILSKNLFWNQELKDILAKKFNLNIFYFEEDENSYENLKKHFWVENLVGFNLENKKLAINAANLVLDYLKSIQKTDLWYLNKLSFETFSDNLDLDETTIKSLDLLYNFSTNSSKIWTLLWVLDKTNTAMWKRFLREAIVTPLQDIDVINTRLNIIEEFLKDSILLDKVNNTLKQIADLDNILTRLALWRANPRDLLNMKRSLQAVLDVYQIILESWNKRLINLLKLK